jgi:TonB-linked SusC/RagA family outer membrane protein
MRLRFKWIYTLILAFLVQFSFAQEKTVTGVVSENGMPLPGATVVIKGTSKGVSTDFDGKYAIAAKTGDVLEISYVGMKTKTMTVGASNKMDVVLELDALDEIVISTYGKVSQRELTSNVGKTKMETVKSVTSANVAGALQGTTSGIQVNTNSGAPGGEVSIRIRGASTISGDSNPLFVIDGIPVFTGITMSNAFGNQQNSALSNINPDDIESIEILKDGAATALFGQRGSNGVVSIKTKRGKAGKVTVNINSEIGFQNPLNKFEIMNYGQWLKYRDDRAFNSGPAAGITGSESAVFENNPSLQGASQDVLNAFYNSVSNKGDNYVDEIYVKDAITHNNNFNFQGGNENSKFYFGASHFFQEGTILTQDFSRKTARLNVDQKISDKLSFNGGVFFADERVNQISGDNNIFGVLSTSLLERPGRSLRQPDGSFTPFSQFTFSNPLQNALVDKGIGNTNRLNLNGTLTAKLGWGIESETTFSLDQTEYKEKIVYPNTTARGNFGDAQTTGARGLIQDTSSRNRIYQIRQGFNVNKSISDLDVRVYLGGEFENRSTDFLQGRAVDIPNPDFIYLNNALTPLRPFSSFSDETRLSGISRLGFTFKKKFILEGTFRADASSKFSENDRWGFFPGASFAYIVSEESFLRNSKVIDNLKLRASYGITGNDSPFGRFNVPVVNATSQYAGLPANFLTIGNAFARWEETSNIDAGFNAKLFKGRIGLGYSYYVKETLNNSLVIPNVTAPSQGSRTVNLNLASMRNSGHEIDLDINLVSKNDFSWNSTVNFSTLDNEVNFLPKNALGLTEPINAGFANRVDEGQPLGFFFVLQADGLYQADSEVPATLFAQGVRAGDVKYIDQNGDGILNNDDFINGGSPWADWVLNWNNQFRFKNFDLSFLWTWSEGGSIFNNNYAFAGISGGQNFNKFTNQLNYWSPTNTNTDIPRPSVTTQAYNNQRSTRFVEDASYIKLRNVTLGYTFKKLKFIQNARVYVSADNLLLITDYSGLDPEVNTFGNTNISRGTDFLTQGGIRVIKFGLNLTF